MTDPTQLRIRIAEAKGLNVVGMAHCWAPDGPPWSVLRDDGSHEGHDYSPVYLVDEDDRTGSGDLLGTACGHPVGHLDRVEDYPGDPREWAVLLEEIVQECHAYELVSPTPVEPGGNYYVNVFPFDAEGKVIRHDGLADRYTAEDPSLGRAVCMAYIAWHDATSGEGSDAG